jgi:putative salt-induced outer membrane protein YdiY
MVIKKSQLAAVISAGLAAAAAQADGVSLYDYSEATSAYEDAYVNGQFNLQSGNQAQSSYNLDLSVDYEKVFSSADHNTKIDFVGDTSRQRGPNDGDEAVSFYQANGAITSDHYFAPNSNGAFWYGKGEVGLQKGMQDPFTKLTAGIGYGRIVNATPMAKSIRLVEALMERGVLTQAPSVAAYQQVANVIAREDEYRSQHGAADYVMAWIADIEKALGSELSVKGAIKSYDVLTSERISTRRYGWLVRAGVGAVVSDYDGESGKPALEAGAEYHKPISNRTQFSEEALVTAVLDSGDNGVHLTNTLTLTHEVSDRIDWENSWLLAHSDYESSADITSNTLSSTYRYYLSNALSYSVTAKLTDIEDGVDGNGNDETGKTLLMGLTYRLK